MAGPFQYEQWIIDSAPCWKCGARVGDPCVAYTGNTTNCHMPRSNIAFAVKDGVQFNGGHSQLLSRNHLRFRQPFEGAHVECMRPLVQQVKARKEWPDNYTPDRPIQPGEHYWTWKPYGHKVMRSRTKPVVGEDGVLFWPVPA